MALMEPIASSTSFSREGTWTAQVALTTAPTAVEMNTLLHQGITLATSCAYAFEFPDVISAMAATELPLDDMITARVGLDDAVRDAFDELVGNGDRHVKILVRP